MFQWKSRIVPALLGCLALITLSFGPARGDQKPLTAADVAESTVYVYGTRELLKTVRVNGIERAIVTIPTSGGERQGQLTNRFVRKDKSWLDLKRLDLVLPDQSLTLGYNGTKLWANLNGVAIEPRPEAEKTFRASLVHNYSSLLRYREDNSTLDYKGIHKVIGLDCHKLELTHEDGAKTTYYISNKTFRILHLEYDLALTPGAEPTKFRVSYYDFKYLQNTLVPMRTVVRENNQISQEIRTTGVTFNIVLDDDVFERY